MKKKQEEVNEMENLLQKDRNFMNIKLKIDGYMKYNNKIIDELEQYLNVLDEKYNTYQYYLNVIHISIICFSSAASFLLAVQSLVYNSTASKID